MTDMNMPVTLRMADGSVETVGIDAVLSGENVLPGFSLDLSELIREAATH